jgi:glucose-fructose oxidoreductase
MMENNNTSRRSFIKKTGTLAMGASVLPIPNILFRKKRRKLGVALVGLGYYSTDLLAPALQETENCYLAGIVTGSPWKIPVWQKKYKIPDENDYNYENMHQIENNIEIDVVYIVLPTGLHSKYSIIAANAGKHVWCEKPMATSVEECQKMIKACKKNKVNLHIGYRMQHEPNTQTIINFGKEKTYGNITSVQAEAGYYEGRTNHWKQIKDLGGGALYDMGVYPINAARYATGEDPIAIFNARHDTKRPNVYEEVDETTYFSMEFPSGAIANCATSFGLNMNRLHVECDRGWYQLEPFQAYSGIYGTTSDGKILEEMIPSQQAKQMDEDALAIMEKSEVLVPGEDGLKDIKIVETIYQSARLGARREIRW